MTFASFAGPDPQAWEPRTSEEWILADPLGPTPFPLWGASRVYAPDSLFETWRRLPEGLRAQTWREREIAATLFQQMPRWQARVTGMLAAGVVLWDPRWRSAHTRHWKDYFAWRPPTDLDINAPFPPSWRWGLEAPLPLAGTVFYPESETANLGRLRAAIEESLRVPSRLPLDRYGFSATVPIVLQTAIPYRLYSAGAAPAMAIQSGRAIQALDPMGLVKLGTIMAIADEGFRPVLVGAGHVFGDPPNRLLHLNSPVADVIDHDRQLDTAIAHVHANQILDATVTGLGVLPGRPMLPALGIPVQLIGAVSGRQRGGSVWSTHVATYAMIQQGVPPFFEIAGHAQGGDSGAVLLADMGFSPAPAHALWQQNPALAALLSDALMGMLVAGPPTPPAPGQRAKLLARSALEIGARFGLTWRVRP